ncbi:MAG: sulfatase [Acidobacteria bacterium]|nr:sulfatase [Acidobacteriota bacterium]
MKRVTEPGRRKNLAQGLYLAVSVFLVACGTGPQVEELDRELAWLLSRSQNLADRAAGFDQERALDDIGIDSSNGTMFRFDEHLGQASYESIGSGFVGHSATLATLGVDGESTRLEGVTSWNVDVPMGRIAALEMEIASPLLGRLEIELQGDSPGDAVTIELPLVGDGVVHPYRFELFETLAPWASERLIRVRFRSRAPRDESPVDIRSVCLLSRQAEYVDSEYGVVHRRHDGETRLSIFQSSSSVMRFTLRGDFGDAVDFVVGGAVLLEGAPVLAEISLIRNGRRYTLLSETIDSGGSWLNWRIPLGKLDADEKVFEFRVTSNAPNVVFWSNPSIVSRPGRPFNVVIVLEDALRADHLSCYGYYRSTTPVKDALAARGARFERCYAQATKTRFSCPSFMTSLYPTATGVEGIWNLHGTLDDNYLTLAEVLRRRGFVTASIHQNANAGSPAGLHQGFSYLFESVLGSAEELYAGTSMQWIEEHSDRNFFLYLHMADPHEPYHPPEDFRFWFDELEAGLSGGASTTRLNRQDPRWMLEARRALYDGEIRANDHWFAAFLQRLEDLGIAEHTLLVFMADHGEHLGEHGLWSHHPPGYVQVLNTPLIMVYPPRIQQGIVIDAAVQNLDIMPTILDLAGVDSRPLLMQGESLTPLMTEGAAKGWDRNLAYSEEALLKKSRDENRPCGSVFMGRWHLLDSFHARIKLFDLELDPSEENPLRLRREVSDRIPRFLLDMQQAELEIWRGITGGKENTVVLDPQTISDLKALGYLE